MDRLRAAIALLTHGVPPNRRPVSWHRSLAPLTIASPVATVVVICSLVVLGAPACRVAPPPLTATYDSPEALARAVIDRLAERDAAGLRGMALTRDEFQAHVWPYLPASRPETNMPMGFVWDRLEQNSDLHLAQTVARRGGTRYHLVSVVFRGSTTRYGPLTVTRESELTVRTPDGTVETIRVFGSVLSDGRRHKLFSFVVE
jgi:hypothetical protein